MKDSPGPIGPTQQAHQPDDYDHHHNHVIVIIIVIQPVVACHWQAAQLQFETSTYSQHLPCLTKTTIILICWSYSQRLSRKDNLEKLLSLARSVF